MPNYLGQHFLKNEAIIKKIVKAIDIQPDDTVIEIGPGRGALTFALAETCQSKDARLIAIEKDQKLAEELQKKGFEVRREDALKAIESDAVHLAGAKLVGNIPYYITGHLLRIVSELQKKPVKCVLMIQEEVAFRLIAEPPRMNRLAASVQRWASAKIIAHVPKADFTPAPKVNSAVIILETRQPEADSQANHRYYAAVRALFAQPRKTILNNLEAKSELKKSEITAILDKLGINPGERPQDLTISEIDVIAKEFFSSVDKRD